jgi:hypothetical protein
MLSAQIHREIMETLNIIFLVVIGILFLTANICWNLMVRNLQASDRRLGWNPVAYYKAASYTEKGIRFRRYFWIFTIALFVVCFIFGFVD